MTGSETPDFVDKNPKIKTEEENEMLKNKYPTADWRVGERCFYQETWSQNVVSGTIKKLETSEGAVVATIDGGPEMPGCVGRPLDTLFKTRAAATAAAQEASRERIFAYESEMPDVDRLVAFAWTHNVATCEEYTDWEARAAFKNRVRALLALELPD